MANSPSLYAQYLTERTDDSIYETPTGFATYRYMNEGKTVYIVDIFVLPEFRMRGHAAQIADEIAKIAKRAGATEMYGTVNPTTKGANESIRVLMAYGMTLLSAANDIILFRKDI